MKIINMRKRIYHTLLKFDRANNIDPDDGNSTLCSACRIPIFSTPIIIRNNFMLHDQCADDLPMKLENHPVHPSMALQRRNQQPQGSAQSCDRCGAVCGSVFYECPDIECRYQLDVACAVSIKILHRSHPHRLTAVRLRDFLFICSICKTDHTNYPRPEELWSQCRKFFYVCITCTFWVHPDCALLPNVIVVDQHHPHPLLLTYDPDELGIPRQGDQDCAICSDQSQCIGFYVCIDCRYYVHSKCAISRPHKQVLIGEAKIPNLIRLPVPDEHTSVMPYLIDQMTVRGDRHDDDRLFEDNKIHEHPLIFHDHHHATLVCNACVGSISSSDPFYMCTNDELCRDFFLHTCCAHLPATLTARVPNITINDIPFSLLSKVDTALFNLFPCYSCSRLCNGFAYNFQGSNFYLDVVCATMTALISHDAHGKAHVLQQAKYIADNYHCCRDFQGPSYKCSNCHDFNLHIKCALLPNTVTHKFDRHPLKLIMSTSDERVPCRDQDHQEPVFCEICEKDIDDHYWYYGCKQCDQSFHIDCIPCVDKLSKIKFGFTIHVECHDCPLACIRALTVDGYRCGHCQEIIREDTLIAFECSKCYFRIHKRCAEKLVIKS